MKCRKKSDFHHYGIEFLNMLNESIIEPHPNLIADLRPRSVDLPVQDDRGGDRACKQDQLWSGCGCIYQGYREGHHHR